MSEYRRGLSLEQKLPLLITALLLALVIIGSSLAYREVRQSAQLAAADRLDRMSGQFSDLIHSSMLQRVVAAREVAASSTVRSLVLRAGRVGARSRAAVRAELERLRRAPDSTFAIELWGHDRALVAQTGVLPAEWRPGQADSVRRAAVLPDSGGYSQLIVVGSRPYIWIAAPVTALGETVGEVAQLRLLGSPTAESQIAALIGAGATLYLANSTGGPWIMLDGKVRSPPTAAPLSELAAYDRPNGGSYIAHATSIVGSPLSVVVEMPMSEVMRRPADFLRRLLVGALLLMVIGAVGAWLVSRRITVPLRRLGEASRGIAAGDYTRRAELDRGDELGSLASAFDTMAAEVEAAHEALRLQYDQAHRLADDLRESNARLTEAKDLAERARSQAEAASRVKSEFLATMSHEVRTPINAIIGYTDLLQLEVPGPLTEEQRTQLERIRMSGRLLITLVDEVLDLARIESGRLQVEDRAARAGDAVEEAVAVVAPEADRKGVRLRRACGGDPDLRYAGDPQRVNQILINLLSNAVKFTPADGRVSVSVERETRGEDGDSSEWVCVVVEDTGVGIPPEQLDRIFEPFVQGQGGYTRVHGGVGLGLAISRRLARMMGGDIDVESEPGYGSRFSLRLPSTRSRDVAA